MRFPWFRPDRAPIAKSTRAVGRDHGEGAASDEGNEALTMQGVEHNGHEELTLLELVLQLHGEFRRSLEPIRVTPLQAGVLLYLQRHMDARVTDAATVLRLRLPTLSEVVKDLVRKQWVTKRYSTEDHRAVCLRLSRRGEALGQRIEGQVRHVSTWIHYKIVAKQKL
jgi:DNA-binding MarR family transcriptional regulator